MAVDTAKTLTSAGTGGLAVKNRFYDTMFLRIAQSKLVHKQVGQVDRNIPQGQGGYGTGAVYWTRWLNLTDVSAGQGEGVPTSAVSMSAVNVTGTTAQYDNAVSISDILAYVSFGDIMKESLSRLAYNAGKSIDNAVKSTIITAGTLRIATGAASASAVPTTGTLSINEVKKAVRGLRRNDSIEQDDGAFVAVVHTDSLYDLMVDTTTGGWVDANKYTDSNVTKIMAGEAGKVGGSRFLESTNAPVLGGSSSGIVASGTLYVTNFFAKDAFGVTELQNLKTFIKPFGSSGVADPTDKIATAGWKTLFGTAPLNSTFQISLIHAVSTTA